MPIQAWRHLLKYLRGEDMHLQLNTLAWLTSPGSPLARADHVVPPSGPSQARELGSAVFCVLEKEHLDAHW